MTTPSGEDVAPDGAWQREVIGGIITGNKTVKAGEMALFLLLSRFCYRRQQASLRVHCIFWVEQWKMLMEALSKE